MNKKSLYGVVVSLCAVACAFTVVSVNTKKVAKEKEEALKTNEEIIKSHISGPVTEEKEEKNIPEKSDEEEIAVSKDDTVSVVLPLENGDIITEFTDSVLVFNETYQDYRTHNGIDITAKKDSPVRAVKKGTVIKNEFDYEDGYTVEIEHDDGAVSVYKNLSTDKMVKVGQVVNAGETIGTIGDTAVSESTLPSHIHFEVKEDNVEIDPQNYLDFSN